MRCGAISELYAAAACSGVGGQSDWAAGGNSVVWRESSGNTTTTVYSAVSAANNTYLANILHQPSTYIC